LAASMTLDMANTEKLVDFRQDAGRLGIEVVPPSVQTSFRHFQTGPNRIYYSLAALKGVGDAAVEHIVAVRGDTPFADLEDFCVRIDPKQINRRVFEGLIFAGAFDCFGRDRAEMIAGMDRIIGYVRSRGGDRAGADFVSQLYAVVAIRKTDARVSGSGFLPFSPSAGYL
jgi:DNA polymerase III subunit alpha